MPLPPEVAAEMGATAKPAQPEKTKQKAGDTSQAAKAILEKYMKRPRS
jgi:hypothetical protein